jgi:hypothetical protein
LIALHVQQVILNLRKVVQTVQSASLEHFKMKRLDPLPVVNVHKDSTNSSRAVHFAFRATQERIKLTQSRHCATTAQPTGSQTRVVNHNVKNVLHLKCLPRDKLFVANVKQVHFWRTMATDFVTDVQVATLLRTARENALSVKQVTLATALIRHRATHATKESTAASKAPRA